MKIYPYLSYRREINETDVNYTCNWQKVWYSSDSLNGNGCSLLIFIRSTIPFISGDFFRAYGKAGIRNRKRNRKRKRKRNWNPNPNLRNKNWGRFCLKSVTNNNCSIKTSSPHYIYLLLLYFLLSHFLRTAQNFSSRISYTRERCNLGSWLTWVLLLPLPPFPHNGWNTEPF